MGEEEVTVTFLFNLKEINIKVDPALLDAVEQEMKLYDITFEEIISVGYQKIFSKYTLDELLDINLNEFGIAFPADVYEEEMSVSEFINLKSTNSEITKKQIQLLSNRKKNLEFMRYVNEKALSANQKRLDWMVKSQEEKNL